MKFNWFLRNSYVVKPNGKRYDYYSIAESYRTNRHNKHRDILYLGALEPERAQKITNLLKTIKSKDAVVVDINEVLFEDHWRYLDIAFLGKIFDDWELSDVFPYSKDKDIQTADIVKILTSYRSLDPGSYLYSTEWLKETAWSMILKIDENKFNDSRIYRELTEIENKKEYIERHIFNTLKLKDEESFSVIYYDLSVSSFEGRKCALAKPGITKNKGFKNKRIILSLVVNSDGYPFSWEVLKGDTAEVNTLKAKMNSCRKRFEISDDVDFTWVFDQGIVSEGNLKYLEENKQKYITAKNKNQIPKVSHINLNWFKEFTLANVDSEVKKLESNGFKKYDDDLYYRDMGDANVKDNAYSRRYIVGFNPTLFKDERENRKEQIKKGFEYIESENEELSKAKRDRGEESTEKRIDENLKKLGVKGHIKYGLETINVKTDKGKTVKSFYCKYWKNENVVKVAECLDGVNVFITNHLKKEQECRPDNKKFDAVRIIRAYRDKNRVEEAFKGVKKFIKFEPIYVRTDQHVKAHYTICVLSYLLDLTITQKLREHEIDEINSVRKVYQKLKRGLVGEIKLGSAKHTIKKMITIRPIEKKILNLFGGEYLCEKSYLQKIGID